MLRTRTTRIAVTIGSVAAIIALTLLPAEHLHHEERGPVVIHRHLPEQTVAHGGVSFDHADDDATILEPVFVCGRQFVVVPPVTTAGEPVTPFVPRCLGRILIADIPRLHGPPIRFDSLPAPPA